MTISANLYSSEKFVAVYSGTSQYVPRSTTLYNINITLNAGPVRINCIWALHAPNGTKIKLKVFDIDGEGMLLKVFDGKDPANGIPILVKGSDPKLSKVPLSVLSHESQVTIVLGNIGESAYFYAMRIVLTPYEIVGKKRFTLNI